MGTHNLIKKTRSYCPECMVEIDADIVEENNKAVMIKECLDHGKFKAVIENDVDLYQKILSHKSKKEIKQYYLVIPITYKCNLNCKFCYLPYAKDYKLSDEEIKKYIDNSKHSTIAFSGGEPTLHPNLANFITYAKSKNKNTCIVTNGIKLTDQSYLKELKNSGLDHIIFSWHGFNDEVLEHIDGQALLAVKEQTFKNIKKAKIKTTLSFSWLLGINDQEFKRFFQLALKNNKLVEGIRGRIYSELGRHENTSDSTLSDFIKLLAQATNIPKEEYISYWLNQEPPAHYNFFIIDYYNFIFNRSIVKKLKSSILTYPLYLLYLIKHLGFLNLARVIRNKLEKKKQPSLVINISNWLDSADVDINELESYPVDHVAIDGSVNGFFKTMFLNEKIRKDGNSQFN